MTISAPAARRLLTLCGLIPLPDLTQDEVDYLFRRLVEDAPPGGPARAPIEGPDDSPPRA